MTYHLELLVIGFLWTLAATFQDLKEREVANWLNFSLIIVALAYRSFISARLNDPSPFLLGLAAFAVFFALAHILYYAHAFAGGDAKLLMGLGIVLPYTSYFSVLSSAFLFILLLFLVGSIYSLLYSLGIVVRNRKKFTRALHKNAHNHKLLLLTSGALFLGAVVLIPFTFFALPLALLFVIPILYTYTRSLDVVLIKKVRPNKLTEGDWILKDIKVRDRIIRKTVHGLTDKDIQLLKKAHTSIEIKEGIPFVPAFLLAIGLMVFFAETLLRLFSSVFLF